MSLSVLHLYGGLDLPESHIAKGLSQAGVALDIFAEEDAANLETAQSGGARIIPWNPREESKLSSIRMLREHVRKNHYDIVHTYTTRNLTLINLALTGITRGPAVIAYRGAIGNVYWYDPSCWPTYFHPRVKRIVCVSRAVEDDLAANGVRRSRLQTIYKGHRTSWYNSEPVDIRSQHNIPENALLAGCTANMRRTKGADILLRAARMVAERGHDLHYLLIGEMRDPEIEALARAPELEGKLHFTGFRSDAPRLIQECDVCVMPSRNREGLPKGVIEAMAQGVPAVVTAVGGMPELVRDGIDGLVVPKENPAALADAIEKIVVDNDFRKRAGVSSKSRIDESFSVDTSIAETLKLYLDVASAAQRQQTSVSPA